MITNKYMNIENLFVQKFPEKYVYIYYPPFPVVIDVYLIPIIIDKSERKDRQL